jgi:hypothetical protein
MPTLRKGIECIKILLSQASKNMYEPIVPMLFPVLGAHMSDSEFQYPDLTWKEHVAKWPIWWPENTTGEMV